VCTRSAGKETKENKKKKAQKRKTRRRKENTKKEKEKREHKKKEKKGEQKKGKKGKQEEESEELCFGLRKTKYKVRVQGIGCFREGFEGLRFGVWGKLTKLNLEFMKVLMRLRQPLV
jgi:hypothetical protein